MRYRLRTLVILMAVGPPIAAWFWFAHRTPISSSGMYIGFVPQRQPLPFTMNDAGTLVVAAIMILVIMGAMAWNRRADKTQKAR